MENKRAPKTEERFASAWHGIRDDDVGEGQKLEVLDQSQLLEELRQPPEGVVNETDGIPVSCHNALVLNEEYQERLQEMLGSLNDALDLNQRRLCELDDQVNRILSEVARTAKGRKHRNPKTAAGAAGNGSGDYEEKSRKVSWLVFVHPYFKDINHYSHPDNPDTKRRRQAGGLDPYLAVPKEWSKRDKKILLKTLRRHKVEKTLREAKKGCGFSDVPMRNPELLPLLGFRWLHDEKAELQDLPDLELFRGRDEEFDWMRVSVEAFKGTVSAASCRLMWQNLLHPTINRAAWSKAEDRNLKRLVEHQLGGDDWDPDDVAADWEAVAEELGTRRTAFQCFMRFQQRHNSDANGLKWTPEEDERLLTLVQRCRMSRIVGWAKVAYHMPKKNKDQCYRRYTNHLRPKLKKGPFLELEDHVIAVGVELFGKNWHKIKEYLPNRISPQVYSRYTTFLSANFGPWTKQDDFRLLELAKEKGCNDWAALAREFGGGRTRLKLRERFMIIQSKFDRDPESFNLGIIRYPQKTRVTVGMKRQASVFQNLGAKLLDFIENRGHQRSLPARDDGRGGEDGSSDEYVEDEGYRDEHQGTARKSRGPSLLQQHKVLPEGMRVNRKVLLDFLQSLYQDLLDIHCSEEKTLAPQRCLAPREKNPPAAVVTQMVIPRRNKDRNPSYEAFFRGTWACSHSRSGGCSDASLLKIGGRRPAFLKETLESLNTYARLLNVDPVGWQVERQEGARSSGPHGPERQTLRARLLTMFASEENRSFLDEAISIRKGVSRTDVPTRLQPAQLPPPSFPLPVRTYSRKRPAKQTVVVPAVGPSGNSESGPVRETGPSLSQKPILTLLIPNLETLVGFRGFLSQIPTWAKMVAPDRKLAITLDKILHLGASQILPVHELLPSAGGSSSGQGTCAVESAVAGSEDRRLTPQEADNLLVDRFLSLFFWPGCMSNIEPRIPEDLFLPSGNENPSGPSTARRGTVHHKEAVKRPNADPVAAADPFDATEIIEKAMQRSAGSKPLLAMCVKAQGHQGDVNFVPDAKPPLHNPVSRNPRARPKLEGGTSDFIPRL